MAWSLIGEGPRSITPRGCEGPVHPRALARGANGMEHILELMIGKLLEHGAWGFLVGWLIFQNYKKDIQLTVYFELIDKLQERRASERERNAEVMMASSAANLRLSDAVNSMSGTSKDVVNRIDDCTNAINEAANKISGLQSTIMTDIQNRGRRRV